MADIDTLQQLQTRIAEIERHHEEELRKLKAGHDQLKDHVRCPKSDEHYAHTMPEHTQGESHPQNTSTPKIILVSPTYTILKGGLLVNTPFVDRIMEADMPLGWKPLNLEQCDGTIDLNEHLDIFLT